MFTIRQLAFALVLVLGCSCQFVLGNEAESVDVNALFRSLASRSEPQVTIPPGVYRLPKGGLTLSGAKNVIINASGVTFLATDIANPALRMLNCENVTLRGGTFDYDPLPFTQGSITAFDAKTRTAEVEIHAGYPDVTNAYTARNLLHLFEKDSPRWKLGAPDFYAKKIEILSPRTCRVFFSADTNIKLVKVGDRVVFNIRQVSGVEMKAGCRGITFEDVTIYTAPALGILVRFCEDAGTFKNVRIVPGPKPAGANQERLFSTCADAMNVAYTRKGPTLENCEFAYMGDDSVNLHGVTLPVLKWIDDRTFLSMRPQKGDSFEKLLRPGDEVRFLKEPNYEVVTTGKIEEATAADEKRETWYETAHKIWPTFRKSESAAFYRIRLTAPVSGVAAGDFCDVPATSAPGFVIRNSSFHDHRGRGLRLMSNEGVVENNRFERIKGAAISIGPEFAFWREAGWCRNITVRGNQIINVGEGENITRRDSYSPGAISIMGRVLPQGAQTRYYPGNEDITISGNTIDGCSVSGISVAAAKNVKISDNTIRRVNLSQSSVAAAEYGLASREPISVIQAQAEVSDNHIEPSTPAKVSANP